MPRHRLLMAILFPLILVAGADARAFYVMVKSPSGGARTFQYTLLMQGPQVNAFTMGAQSGHFVSISDNSMERAVVLQDGSGAPESVLVIMRDVKRPRTWPAEASLWRVKATAGAQLTHLMTAAAADQLDRHHALILDSARSLYLVGNGGSTALLQNFTWDPVGAAYEDMRVVSVRSLWPFKATLALITSTTFYVVDYDQSTGGKATLVTRLDIGSFRNAVTLNQLHVHGNQALILAEVRSGPHPQSKAVWVSWDVSGAARVRDQDVLIDLQGANAHYRSGRSDGWTSPRNEREIIGITVADSGRVEFLAREGDDLVKRTMRPQDPTLPLGVKSGGQAILAPGVYADSAGQRPAGEIIIAVPAPSQDAQSAVPEPTPMEPATPMSTAAEWRDALLKDLAANGLTLTEPLTKEQFANLASRTTSFRYELEAHFDEGALAALGLALSAWRVLPASSREAQQPMDLPRLFQALADAEKARADREKARLCAGHMR